jgi:hypothetical protein
MDNQLLGKLNLNLNKFKLNLEVNQRIVYCEPQIPRRQIYLATRCIEKLPSQIPPNSEFPMFIKKFKLI